MLMEVAGNEELCCVDVVKEDGRSSVDNRWREAYPGP
jgi:hypothetical protein